MSCKKCGYGDIRQVKPEKYCENHFMISPKDMTDEIKTLLLEYRDQCELTSKATITPKHLKDSKSAEIAGKFFNWLYEEKLKQIDKVLKELK